MPKILKEQEKEYLARIRRLLVINPTATILSIADVMHLDKNYVNRLVRKIRGERTHRLNFYTINVILAKFEDLIKESDMRLWNIINNPDKQDKDVITALKELRQNQLAVIEKMFDAGVFERQLGKLKTDTTLGEEEQQQIADAINYALNSDKPTRDTRPSK